MPDAPLTDRELARCAQSIMWLEGIRTMQGLPQGAPFLVFGGLPITDESEIDQHVRAALERAQLQATRPETYCDIPTQRHGWLTRIRKWFTT